MSWYYVVNDERQGPFGDEEFKGLVEAGTVTAKTLVWQSGMAEWLPYGEVRPDFSAPDEADLSNCKTAYCANCRGHFEVTDMQRSGDLFVCRDCVPAFQQSMAQGTGPRTIMEYAGFWVRFAAFVIDSVILTGVHIVVSMPFMPKILPFYEKLMANPETPPPLDEFIEYFKTIMLVWALQMFVMLCYYVFFHGRFGATPGKLICGIRVVRSNGERISYLRALGRLLGFLLSCVILYLGCLIAAFDSERRALHDMLCDTRVVYKPLAPKGK